MADLARGELATNEQEIITECQQRFTFSQEGEGKNRSEFEFDKRFVSGDQWDPTIRDERFSDRRPCLTVNITDAICRRVINNCRQNRPRICTHPVGNGADVETSKVYDGLIRHIEYRSNAEFIYDTAVENAVQGGWGWIALDHEFENEKSFNQELVLRPYPNPLMCYGDPNSRMPDGSDMEWFIETEFMKRVVYKERFGELDPTGWRWVGRGDDVPDWSNKEEIRVAKYWRVERKKDKLLLLGDGSSEFASEVKGVAALQVLKSRELYRREIHCYLLTSNKILTETTWPGRWIPRVPVYGRRQDMNGKMTLKGMVRDLRDPARIYNYAKTKETEMYAMQPQAQWVGPEGFMDGKEAAWRDTNRKPIVALEYKVQQHESGELLPPPTRLDPPAVNQGFGEWAGSSRSDFLAVAGMSHEPEMDKEGEVISGIAIKRREGLADVSNFDFYDNLVRSLRHLGRMIVDAIPHFYDAPRMIRIIREDGTAESIGINQPQLDPMTQAVLKVKNDLTVGDYEVIVDTGPSYQTKREQSAEAMIELLGTPAGEMVAQTAADLMVRAMDFPNSDMVADRLAAVIPAAQMDQHLEGLPPKAQAMIASLSGQLKQAQQQLLAAHLEIKTKSGIEQMKQQGETQRTLIKESHEDRRAGLEAHTKVHDTHVKAVTAHDVAEIQVAGKMMDSHLDRAHEREMGEREFEREAAMTGAEMGHESLENARSRHHEATEAARGRAHESHEAERGRQHESQEADKGRKHESTEAQRERKHSSSEAQHQRGHEARQSSAERNSRKPK